MVMLKSNQVAETLMELSDIIDLMPYEFRWFKSDNYREGKDDIGLTYLEAKKLKHHRGVLIKFRSDGNIFFNDFYKKRGGIFEGTFDDLMAYLREEYNRD